MELSGKTVLITGAAGFIGCNLALELLKNVSSITIIGVDNLSPSYDLSLKEYRLGLIKKVFGEHPDSIWLFLKKDISDADSVKKIFSEYKPEIVVNLAAQAGVRYSVANPDAYIESNVIGYYNILEACRHSYDNGCPGVKHLVYASSSSVYGNSGKTLFEEDDKADRPLSFYAATKRADELMAYAYSKLYNIPSTGLRFFSVYGPGGRPDMAYFTFTDLFVRREKIKLFNNGKCKRDFIYIDDVIDGIKHVMQNPPLVSCSEDGQSDPPYSLYNLGTGYSVELSDFIKVLEDELVKARVLPEDYDFAAHEDYFPMQPGDIFATCADTASFKEKFGFEAKTPLRAGLRSFARWYKEYYKI